MALQPRERVVAISGGSRGIGKACVKWLFEHTTYRITVGVRDSETTKREFQTEIDRCAANNDYRLQFVRYDATEPETANAWARAAVEKFGYVSDLFLNAGQSRRVGLMSSDEDGMREDFEVNFFGPWRLFKAFGPYINDAAAYAAKNPEEKSLPSVIFNVSEAALKIDRSASLSYHGSKSALLTLVFSVRAYFAENKVDVRVEPLCLSHTATEMNKSSTKPQEQKIQTEFVAMELQRMIETPRQIGDRTNLVPNREEWSKSK